MHVGGPVAAVFEHGDAGEAVRSGVVGPEQLLRRVGTADPAHQPPGGPRGLEEAVSLLIERVGGHQQQLSDLGASRAGGHDPHGTSDGAAAYIIKSGPRSAVLVAL